MTTADVTTPHIRELLELPYGALLWPLVDTPAHLLADLLEGSWADDPDVLRAVAATAMCIGMRHVGLRTFGDDEHPLAEFAQRHGRPNGLGNSSTAERTRAVLDHLDDALSTAGTLIEDQAVYVRFTRAAVGMVVASAVSAHADQAASMIPSVVSTWATEGFTHYIP